MICEGGRHCVANAAAPVYTATALLRSGGEPDRPCPRFAGNRRCRVWPFGPQPSPLCRRLRPRASVSLPVPGARTAVGTPDRRTRVYRGCAHGRSVAGGTASQGRGPWLEEGAVGNDDPVARSDLGRRLCRVGGRLLAHPDAVWARLSRGIRQPLSRVVSSAVDPLRARAAAGRNHAPERAPRLGASRSRPRG